MTMPNTPSRIIDSRHPAFTAGSMEWDKWRLSYRGGSEFRDRYLEQFTTREDPTDFAIRKRLTPVPAFAKAAINDIRNAIFQRMPDITRVGGSKAYREAASGKDMGVDRRGSSMNAFLGVTALTEMLVMGRCGIFVDNSVIPGSRSVADAVGARPYLYAYQAEDILSWSPASSDNPSEYQSLLLRDTCMSYDERTSLPMLAFQRYRLLWLQDNQVMLQFYDMNGQEVDRDNKPSADGPTALELNRIPFVMPDLGDSLMKDVCDYQIAMLNLLSRNIWYDLQANFTFYVEQRDMRAIGSHLKQATTDDGTATTGGQGADDKAINVGANHGRAYGKDLNAPAFISPSSEPLQISLQLQEKLESDMRKIVNLSASAMATRGSAESKSLDNQGLEAGLSFIGSVLQNAEQQIAGYWAAYENRIPKKRHVATIKYPDRYSLKTDADRIEEARKLAELIYKVPGQTAKREIAKNIVTVLLGGKVDVGTIDKIHAEIDKSTYLTSDPDTIIAAVEAGLCDEETGSEALGFGPNVYLQAREDHLLKAVRLIEAQAKAGAAAGLENPAARGAPALAVDPKADVKAEKEAATDDTLTPTKGKKVRGKASGSRVTGKPKAE
jgi:hypothetical protein